MPGADVVRGRDHRRRVAKLNRLQAFRTIALARHKTCALPPVVLRELLLAALESTIAKHVNDLATMDVRVAPAWRC